jgi:tetratricopeptide (TPR) repeat protein
MAIPLFRWLLSALTALFWCCGVVHAQPGYSFELKKPAKYEERKLASERTEEKKFGVPRKFVQNTVTHYNYWFNANVKINEVVDRAKQVFVDDYTRLLPFYNYTLTGTSMFKTELDSVIYKSTNGILLHDLRNSWIDNLYMLLGRAYYYRNTLDSAYLTFQFVNFAFSPKDKDGYDKPIGSNAEEGSNAFSISTKENRNIFNKALSEPPSRNDALIWLIRTHLANKAYPEAAGLIETLQADPSFPVRLGADLAEVTALWFYDQAIYDSAAFYLEKALPNAANKTELARWEYLLAQLLERSGQPAAAKTWYEKCIKHTMNPVMEVYAMLNGISQHDGSEKAVPDALEELLKMAKKDRYEKYQEIIFYTAAQIELKRKDTTAAIRLLQTGINRSLPENKLQRARCYYELGNLQYEKRLYIAARNSYDSVDVSGIDSSFLQPFTTKKESVALVAAEAEIVKRQDSLQVLANMNEMDRDALVKKEAKRLRRAQGLKDEEAITGGGTSPLISNPNNPAPATNFGSTSLSGEWYFQNKNLRSKGYNEFKRKWGSRPNIDNWRRMSAVDKTIGQGLNNNPVTVLNQDATPNNEISYANLLSKIPLSPEKMQTSNDSIQQSLLQMGVLLQNRLENYPGAIAAYEELLRRFPQTKWAPDALFGLYYCYGKTGQDGAKLQAARLLQQQHPQHPYADLAAGKKPPVSADSLKKQEATRTYAQIYDHFIGGDFNRALAEKKKADSLYGDAYWNPQLLYIESIYHIRERNDSVAILTLQQVIQRYPQTQMAAKATTLIDVLRRRTEIEDYLTKLQVERPATETLQLPAEMEEKEKALKTAATEKPNQPKPPPVNGVIPVPAKPTLAAQVPAYDPTIKLDSAGVKGLATKDNSKPKAAPSVQTGNKKPTAGIDPKQLAPITVASSKETRFPHQPNAPQMVALILEKVDPVYVTEAKNAFARYNREKYYGQTIELTNVVVSDTLRLLTFSEFADARAAIAYIEKAKPLASTEIIPWLRNDKYRFILLSKENLQQLIDRKETRSFESFLQSIYPGKF